MQVSVKKRWVKKLWEMKRRFPALQHKNFRYFLSGQCISLVGTWMQRAAQQWVVYDMTHSPFILGLVGVFQFTPMLLLSLFAGVFVDRFPKKKLLLVTQTIQMFQAFILAALLWSGHIQYWHVLIMAGFLGLVNTFDMPTKHTFFIELVEGKEDLVSAIGLNSTIVNLARITGPALGGLFLSYAGAAWCFFVNGLSFIAVIIGLVKIKSKVVHIRAERKDVLYEITDGLKYIFSKKVLSEAVISMLIVGTVAMNSDIIIPVFVKQVLKQEAAAYGIMLSAMGLGSLAGSLIFAVGKRGGFGRGVLVKSAFMLCFFLVATGLMPNYYLALVSLAAVGLFSMIFMATVNSTIQMNASDAYRGRAVSVYTLVFTGTTPIGNFFTGLVNQKFGPGISFISSGVICGILMLLLIVLSRDKGMQRSHARLGN